MPPGLDLTHRSTSPCLLALAGGFLYFDASGALCAVNAISNVLDASQEDDLNPDGSALTAGTGHASNLLQFAAPLPLTDAAVAELRDRMHPVTLAALLSTGATRFAWIRPSEALTGMARPPPAGAFAYVFSEGACPLGGYKGNHVGY